MPQQLALEWSNREIRVAVGSGRGSRITVEHAFAVPWGEDEASGEPRQQLIGKRIAEELAARGVKCPEALVGVGRSNIELRQIQLPPAPEEELPDMVRFQAAREFNELDDRWLLDFVPIDESPAGARTVLATAIAPATIQQIEAVCQHAGVKPRRLLLRPCEAAALLARDKSAAEQVRLMIVLFADEADLTALVDGKAVFLRTMRFAGERPPLANLAAELRLTIAAVQNQLGGRQVQSIVLAGRDDAQAELARQMEAELGMPVELFDPFAAVELAPAVQEAPPANPERFAPLLGMLLTELAPAAHAIDFLHPRRRREAPNRRKWWVAAATAAALLGVAWLVYSRLESYWLANEVDEMTTRSKELEPALAKAKKVSASAAEIGKWADAEVIWLDQLRGLSEVLPSAKDAVLSELTCDVKGGGQVIVKGRAHNDKAVTEMQERIRAGGGRMTPPVGSEDRSNRLFPWSFETRLLLKTRPKP